MRAMLLAGACAAALLCAGCGGNLIGTEGGADLRLDGARPVPQSYYLPKGEVPITLAWNETKDQFDYVSDYAAVSVPDHDFKRFNLWHKHAGLSREEAIVTVDPKTMLLEKASSIYQPRTREALDATAALIRQTTELRAALASPPSELRSALGTPPAGQPKCDGLKAAARIPIVPHNDFRSVPLTPVVAFGFCNFTLSARVEVLDPPADIRPGVTKRVMRDGKIADDATITKTCAEAICFRLPQRYRVTLNVGVIRANDRNNKVPLDQVPRIPPFEVSAPDRTRIAYVQFPRGVFASKSTTLEFADGMLKTYSVQNESPVVGILTVATSALLVATAAAEIN